MARNTRKSKKRKKSEYFYIDGKKEPITVHLSANGKIYFQTTFCGNSKRIKKTADTLEELKAKAIECLEEAMGKSGNTITYYNACLEYIRIRSGLAKSSLLNYMFLAENRFKCLHNKPIKKLTRTDFYEAINSEKHLAKSTLLKAVDFMIYVCNEFDVPALNINLIREIKRYAVNASQNNSVKRHKEDWENAPTAVEIARWAGENTKKTAERTALTILLDLHSLRTEETRGLQFRDVIEQNGNCYLIICRTRTYMCEVGDIYREATKTEGSTRKILIDRRLYNMIRELPHETEMDFVVNLSYRAYERHIIDLMELHGFRWITPHKLRHIFKTDNKDSTVAKAIGGWSLGPEICERTYTHPRINEKDELMKVYSKRLLDSYYGLPDDNIILSEVKQSEPNITVTVNSQKIG